MKYKSVINNYIFKYLVEAILIVILIVLLSIKIASNLLNNYTTTKNGLIFEVQYNNNKDLSILTDLESIKYNGDIITITNNKDKDLSYKLRLCMKKDDDIKINISNNKIAMLDSYSYEDGCYILDNKTISSKSAYEYNIKLFIPKSINIAKTIDYTFKID